MRRGEWYLERSGAMIYCPNPALKHGVIGAGITVVVIIFSETYSDSIT